MSRFSLATLMFFSALLWAISVNISLVSSGWLTSLGFFYFSVFSPIMDFILPRDKQNPINSSEETELRNHKYFDIVLFSVIPIILFTIYNSVKFTAEFLGGNSLVEIKNNLASKSFIEWITFFIQWLGIATYMGGGVINMGHELGHRVSSWQRYLGKFLLFTSLRMSFYIEHNWGHHKDVSTPLDPASANKWEIFWFFWPKSLFNTWLNSFKIQFRLLKARKSSFFSVYNDAFWNVFIQWSAIGLIGYIFGLNYALAFIIIGQGGALVLEGANYIEHYGLRRKLLDNGNYERTLPIHSWNANHLWTNLMLYNLMRHSDHHFISDRPYQILRDYKEIQVPMLPLAYTGMVIPALFFPPLYFAMMHPKLDYLEKNIEKMRETKFTHATL